MYTQFIGPVWHAPINYYVNYDLVETTLNRELFSLNCNLQICNQTRSLTNGVQIVPMTSGV
jgi:hypothetical protein